MSRGVSIQNDFISKYQLEHISIAEIVNIRVFFTLWCGRTNNNKDNINIISKEISREFRLPTIDRLNLTDTLKHILQYLLRKNVKMPIVSNISRKLNIILELWQLLLLSSSLDSLSTNDTIYYPRLKSYLTLSNETINATSTFRRNHI